MKTIILIRHAKSSKFHTTISDFERPLSNRGESDAEEMGKRFAKKGIKPDLILSSPSVRTYNTVKYFADALNIPIEEVETRDEIYYDDSRQLVRMVNNLDNKINSLMITGHNPDITVLADELGNEYIDHVPTCGVICIDFDTNSWEDIGKKKGKVRFFEYPKS